MKKSFLLFTLLILVCATCKGATASEVRTLVVYYTYSGVTESLAQSIADECGGTLLQVVDHGNYPRPESQQTYSYANNERSQIDAGNWPEIHTSVETFDDWDAIIFCTPLWNGKMANPMLTFMHNHADKLDHKQVALAVTSWSSGISRVVADAHSILPNCSFIGDPLHIDYNHRSQMQEMGAEWLTTLDFELVTNDNIGDVNGDNMVNVSDLATLINLLLGGDVSGNETADVNQDGLVNVADVSTLIDELLNNH